ncbi:hypothetical protein Ae406Ps2_6347c [Pseudonocardia sp. Ae406_Ps2]|uniref:hypothetical protein n=1 Tax=unclassified Pseudonocardia TaxID=2619320 RepID=UPI00094AE930|nr:MULTISPECIES: hypothetical protein [unclassified Pseudonocardia]OLL69955.1 hypothetical protein Ae168Ps1_6433 [Pseudonocardia sp. Ae168_Ps1]OLL70008.1 hypothetical protein Ae263Ps1_6400 [Pseudonocardia sp. Ae263_Ps1]OLL89000.1 hypothetical protein Ae356Ps1_6327c [Pseudonocardia sp. Ae356_Ps1]OLL89450.1 hypothetical protein Ae331Ps2_6270c [Pseudonocardia sp. Ae331_Ps2]OLL89907.1 hypothetical protein Ae406Ps2_6347c [Pseudonocardia sp. Ae406_Ps2]
MTTKNRLREQMQRPQAVDPDAPAPATESAQEASKPARKRSTRTTAEKPAAATTAPAETPTQERPSRAQVLVPPSAKVARRLGLYLHDDDYRTLKTAELEDRADPQDRMRAMLALYRHNDRYRAAVDRLARSAPKGTGRSI